MRTNCNFYYEIVRNKWFTFSQSEGESSINKSNKMTLDSVLFENFNVIIWLGQTLTIGWIIIMVTVSLGRVAIVAMVML